MNTKLDPKSTTHKRNFLMLVAMARPDAQLLQTALARLKREADPNATPAWLDGISAGIFMSTDLSARDILTCILPGNPTHEQRQSVREVLVVELGRESWSSSTTTKAAAWLNSHRLPPTSLAEYDSKVVNPITSSGVN